MSIEKLLSREAAARKIMARTRGWWEHSGETTLRHTVEACLAVALVVTLWSLIRPWLAVKPARAASQNPISTAHVSAMPQAQPSDTNRLVQAHLFGIAKPAQVSLAADPTIQVNGIAYSSDADQSLAILSLNGKTLVVHTGAVLPDGAAIVAIEQDQVRISQNGQVASIMLDLKKAALNAHFTPAQFASGAGAPDSGTGPGLPHAPTIDALPTSVGITPTRRPSTLMPHFESLQALRGPQAMHHFFKLHPPVAAVPPTRQPER